MAADLAAIRSALAVRLATIGGMTVYAVPPPNGTLPAAIIGMLETATFGQAIGRSPAAIWEFPIRVYVANATAPAAQVILESYLSTAGATSVVTALLGDPTLGGAGSLHIKSINDCGTYSFGTATVLGFKLTIEVLA